MTCGTAPDQAALDQIKPHHKMTNNKTPRMMTKPRGGATGQTSPQADLRVAEDQNPTKTLQKTTEAVVDTSGHESRLHRGQYPGAATSPPHKDDQTTPLILSRKGCLKARQKMTPITQPITQPITSQKTPPELSG